MNEQVVEASNTLEKPINLEYDEVLEWVEAILVQQNGSCIDRGMIEGHKQVDALYQSSYDTVREVVKTSNLKEEVLLRDSRNIIEGIIELNAALSYYDGLQVSIINQDGESETVDVKGITCDALNEYYDINGYENPTPEYPLVVPDTYDKYIIEIIDRNDQVYPYSRFQALLIPEEEL